MSKHVICLLLLTLAACGPADKAKTPTSAALVHEYGWLEENPTGGAGIVFRESPDVPGFDIECLPANDLLKVTVGNPVGAPPAAGERAALQLGAQAFDGIVAATSTAALLTADFPVTPQLLVALGDAKTARIVYREAPVDAGVDADGRIADFARRCTALTGVEPAL